MKYYLLIGGLIGFSFVCAYYANDITPLGIWCAMASYLSGIFGSVLLIMKMLGILEI